MEYKTSHFLTGLSVKIQDNIARIHQTLKIPFKIPYAYTVVESKIKTLKLNHPTSPLYLHIDSIEKIPEQSWKSLIYRMLTAARIYQSDVELVFENRYRLLPVQKPSQPKTRIAYMSLADPDKPFNPDAIKELIEKLENMNLPLGCFTRAYENVTDSLQTENSWLYVHLANAELKVSDRPISKVITDCYFKINTDALKGISQRDIQHVLSAVPNIVKEYQHLFPRSKSVVHTSVSLKQIDDHLYLVYIGNEKFYRRAAVISCQGGKITCFHNPETIDRIIENQNRKPVDVLYASIPCISRYPLSRVSYAFRNLEIITVSIYDFGRDTRKILESQESFINHTLYRLAPYLVAQIHLAEGKSYVGSLSYRPGAHALNTITEKDIASAIREFGKRFPDALKKDLILDISAIEHPQSNPFLIIKDQDQNYLILHQGFVVKSIPQNILTTHNSSQGDLAVAVIPSGKLPSFASSLSRTSLRQPNIPRRTEPARPLFHNPSLSFKPDLLEE